MRSAAHPLEMMLTKSGRDCSAVLIQNSRKMAASLLPELNLPPSMALPPKKVQDEMVKKIVDQQKQ